MLGGAGAGDQAAAGAGGQLAAGAGGQPPASAGEAGQGGLGGAPASCVAELEVVPLGAYTLELTSVGKVCLVSDLSCGADPTRSGRGQGTLTLTKSGEDGDLMYIDGALEAPTLDLDGLGRHSESYSGMLVDVGGGFDVGWDTTSPAGSLILWGNNCFGEHGEIGHTLVTVEHASGNISSFARHCETHFETFWHDLTISGTGTLACEATDPSPDSAERATVPHVSVAYRQGQRGALQEQGRLVISLDFELHWGVRDKRSVEQYRENLLGVRKAIPAMLRLFEAFGVHATWATVGFLFFDGKDDLMAGLPETLPAYHNGHYSPYEALDQLGPSEAEDPFHFAPSLVRQIVATPGQELGTHTFSHYYCLEPGNDARAFEADLAAAQRAASRFGVTLQSMVFPRNQVHAGYLAICARQGIRAYRGTQQFIFYSPKSNGDESLWLRAGRLADNYLPLSGHNTFPRPAAGSSPPYDIPASAFLRPYSPRLARLEPLRRWRIFADLSEAAERGRTYHLWWHPHNFGTHLEDNLGFLRRVLEHFAKLRATRNMQSLTMGELADQYDLQREPAA